MKKQNDRTESGAKEKPIGISARNISKSFGNERVLDDVSIEVSSGEIVGIVGANGSGKTVLMKCICGFMIPDGGSVTVNGCRVGRDRDFAPRLGIIIETPGFIPDESGYRNLKILASLRSRPKKGQIIEALSMVGLESARRKKVAKYSLGMRQRLGIAQAVMEDPDVLILDEPFNALDRESAAEMRELLKQLRDRGKAILLASHNQADIAELCDRVLEMEVTKNEM